MSKTTFTTSNALTKKAWEEKLFRDWPKDSYFGKFMGNDSNSIVHVKTQLEKGQGDVINFGIRMRLSGAGITSGSILEGNEEALTTYNYSLSLEQYRHAVRDDGALSRKRAMFSITKEAELAIKDWGSEKLDYLLFDAATSSPAKVFYRNSTGAAASHATAATAADAITAGSGKITPHHISLMKAWAKTGGATSATARQQPPIRPVKTDGGEYYVFCVHPYTMFDLKVDPVWEQAQREAQARGKENPLFKNAAAIWDGVVIHECDKIPLADNASSVQYSKNLFMGAQALVWAWGERSEVVKRDFDYGNEIGFGFGMIGKAGRPYFAMNGGSNADYACLNVYYEASDIGAL